LQKRHSNARHRWLWRHHRRHPGRQIGALRRAGLSDPLPRRTHHQLASVFEPSVATAVFQDMLKEHGVTFVTARLDLKSGVVMDGKRIQKLSVEKVK